MYKISLINMPFISLISPSLGLTKLKSVVDRRFNRDAIVDVLYLNHGFARYIGKESYQLIARQPSDAMDNSDLGEWFFRQSAFPDTSDNTKEYFSHYYTGNDEQTRLIKSVVQNKRSQVDDFLDEMITRYDLDKANIVGFTSISLQNVASFAMARRLKNRNPNIITVIGGPNCEFPMGDAIAKNVEQIDYVFSGPALKSFPEFVQHCLDDEMDKCHRINGVFSKSNRVIISGDKKDSKSACSTGIPYVAQLGEDLDINQKIELDYSSFLDTFEETFPNKSGFPVLLFETSRGCWWGEKHLHCAFCGMNGLNIHYSEMAPENAIAQYKSLFRYSDRCNEYESVDNIMPKKYLREVFPYIDTPFNTTIFCEVRPDLGREDMAILSKARIRMVNPGIEALSTSTLKLMRKGTTAFQNIIFLKNCLICDILPMWYILVGTPGEGEQVYKKYVQDIPLLTHLCPPVAVTRVAFPRHSPYFNSAKEYGLELQPFMCYKLVYPFSEEVLLNLTYWFSDNNSNAEYIVARDKWIGKLRELLDVWRFRWGRIQLKTGDSKARPIAPKLMFKQKGNTTVIYDSRSGQAIEHKVGDIDLKILDYLEKARRVADIDNAFGNIPGLNAKERIAHLQSLGLLFQEGERYLGLVVRNRVVPKKDEIEVKYEQWQNITTSEFLSFLLERDVKLWIDNGNLRYNARPGIVTAELCEELKSRKSEIIMLLQTIA